MKTKAAVLFETNKPLELIELEIPKLKAGQVLVKMAYSGICGSQLSEIQGKWGEDKYIPHLLGHEGSGTIVDIGYGVSKVKLGDKVAVSWIEGDGLKGPPPTYRYNKTIINSGYNSTFSEYSIISENRIYKLNQSTPLDKASIFGCALATGYGAISYDAKVVPGSSLLVYGTGGIALSTIQFAKLVNAYPIIVIGRNPKKLDIANKLGSTHNILLHQDNILNEIYDVTQGEGVDYAIDTTGISSAIEFCYQSIKINKGVVIVLGIGQSHEKISINSFQIDQGKTIKGGGGTSVNLDRDFNRLEKLYNKNILNLNLIITHQFKFDEINIAFDKLTIGGEIGRAILKF